jgi:predicted metalloprotease with PDZ domain
LISHEYFHTWNVKRLKPAEHATLHLQREQPTELLWFFEGFTSYYDDLLLRRAGLIDDARYLKLMAKTLNGVLNTPGRLQQSVAQASFDAWTKYYKADENTPNSWVSYYTKGSLVALALDLSLRMHPNAHLDGIMRRLWASTRGGAMTEADVKQAVSDELGSPAAARLLVNLHEWVHGVTDAPWLDLLQAAGVEVVDHDAVRATSLAAALGLRVMESPATGVVVRHVLTGGAALRAGVAVGDEIVAVDGLRVRRLDDARAWFNPHGTQRSVTLTVSHQQRLMQRVLKAPFLVDTQIKLSPSNRLDGATLRLRQRWLGGD